jgi:hypothetical protein
MADVTPETVPDISLPIVPPADSTCDTVPDTALSKPDTVLFTSEPNLRHPAKENIIKIINAINKIFFFIKVLLPKYHSSQSLNIYQSLMLNGLALMKNIQWKILNFFKT